MRGEIMFVEALWLAEFCNIKFVSAEDAIQDQRRKKNNIKEDIW